MRLLIPLAVAAAMAFIPNASASPLEPVVDTVHAFLPGGCTSDYWYDEGHAADDYADNIWNGHPLQYLSYTNALAAVTVAHTGSYVSCLV